MVDALYPPIPENLDYLLKMYSHAEYFREDDELWTVSVVDECEQVDGVHDPVKVRLMLSNNCRTCHKSLHRIETRFAVIPSYQLVELVTYLSETEGEIDENVVVRHETMAEAARYFLCSDDHEMEGLSPYWECHTCSRLPGGSAWRSFQK